MPDPVNEVSFGVLVWQVKKMNVTGRVNYIHCNVTYLLKAVRSFVQPEEFRDGGGGLGAEFPRRDMRGEWRGGAGVFQKGAVEMDEEELEEHASEDQTRPRP